MKTGNDKLLEILKTLEAALARKPEPIRPQDFVCPATSIKVIHGGTQG